LWSYANHSISKVNVQPHEKLRNIKVTSVAVSQCGNFGVLGHQNGMIQKFNLQSGIDRGTFTAEEDTIHTKEVTGLGLDMLNHHLVSCGLDH
jgi:U3 small nucleolar RNA-associated protein 21